jgi:hypothetical protein
MRQMLVQKFQTAPAVALRIFDLPANLADGFAFPCHFYRRQLPAGVAGNAPERSLLAGENLHVALEVTSAAGIARHAAAIAAARCGRRMRMACRRPAWACRSRDGSSRNADA